MTPKVPISDTGTATEGTSPARTERRKAKVTRTTRITLMKSERSTSFSDARIVVVRSVATMTSTSLGSAACNSGSSSFTLSTVSMMLALGWR